MAFSSSQWDALLTTGGGLVSAAEIADITAQMVGTRLGVFELTEVMGSGGMASVFKARRDDGQFDQQVAVKVLHPGLSDEMNLRRFAQERQILARLDHPEIARVFDGGLTEDQRPYLVMDLVDGIAIDQYCAERKLDLSTRLGLMLQVCDAVQFAHNQLVVHCDLKPGNILVDARGKPRLLDFGIAQIFSRGEGSDSRASGSANPFTPLYAAPEQFRGEDARVATDIYQLGLLMVVLISGQHPYQNDADDIGRLTRHVLDQAPPAPSQIATAECRRLATARRWRELDAICRKCMAREPTDRYLTVAEMMSDLRAVMNRRPVAAVAGGQMYRLGRFLSRNRAAIVTAAGSLVVLAAVAGWLQFRVAEERQRASDSDHRAAAMTAFLSGITEVDDPLAGDFVGKELISVSSFELSDAMSRNPQLQREFVLLSGRALVNLGQFDRLIELLEPLVADLEGKDDPPPRLGEYLSLLGYANFHVGRIDLGRGQMQDALLRLKTDPGQWQQTGLLTARRLARLERSVGGDAEALRVLAEAIAHSCCGRLADDGDLAGIYFDMGLVQGEIGDYAAALDAVRTALELAPEGGLVVPALSALADLELATGQLESASSHAAQAVAAAAPQSAQLAGALVSRANVHLANIKVEAAIQDYRSGLALYRDLLGPDHREVGRVAGSLARALKQDARCSDALPLFDEALRIASEQGEAKNLTDQLKRQRAACGAPG